MRTPKFLAPVGLFILMAFWEYLSTLDVIYTADLQLVAVPITTALAVCSFLGLTSLRRTWAFAVAWVGGTAVGTTLGILFPLLGG